MEREATLLVLSLAICAPLCVAFGAMARPIAHFERSGQLAEARAWRRLWLPLVPGCAALAILLGWALHEPDPTDEGLDAMLLVGGIPGAIVLARALARALISAASRHEPLVATIGLLRPRVVIHESIARALCPDSLAAVRAHESAHATHRDPLRIWLAQLAVDLQWPAPSARRRFAHWLHTLEVARDEEAREAGVCGDALAAAIVSVARVAQARSRACAALLGQGDLLRDRIARLLRPMVPSRRRRTTWLFAAVVAVLVGGIAAGFVGGDDLLRCLPGVS